MMRPTFHEQIERTGQILEKVVFPAVSGDYPTEILRGLIGNLTMLSSAWPLLGPFLEWDNDETDKLVASLGGSKILGTAAPSGGGDLISLSETNQLLRQQLSDCLSVIPQNDPRMLAVRDHLMARSIRYPMRSTLPTPKSPVPEAK